LGARPVASRCHEDHALLRRAGAAETALYRADLPYIERTWCEAAITAPIRSAVQPDGRIRFWTEITLPSEPEPHVLRVVTLEDGETVHNAFFDRNFHKEP
jgi:hypothetical protein